MSLLVLTDIPQLDSLTYSCHQSNQYITHQPFFANCQDLLLQSVFVLVSLLLTNIKTIVKELTRTPLQIMKTLGLFLHSYLTYAFTTKTKLNIRQKCDPNIHCSEKILSKTSILQATFRNFCFNNFSSSIFASSFTFPTRTGTSSLM